jgi:hypothetical protein
MLLKRIKIPVAVQQLHAVHDAAGRDHGVDGLAHRDAKGTQLAKILGGVDGEFQATQVDGMQGGERSLHRLALAARTRRFERVGQSRRRCAYAHYRHP